MMNHKEWIIVASRKSAKVFTRSTREPQLKYLETIKNSLGRTRNKEMMTDKPGISRNKFIGASGVHSMTGEKNPHEDATKEFSKVIAKFISKHQLSGDYDELTIAAEPHMLGLLKAETNSVGGNEKFKWIAKDLEKFPTSKLEEVFSRTA